MKVLSFLRSPEVKYVKEDLQESPCTEGRGMPDDVEPKKQYTTSNFWRNYYRSKKSRIDDNGSSLSSLYLSEDGTFERYATRAAGDHEGFSSTCGDLGAEWNPMDFSDIDAWKSNKRSASSTNPPDDDDPFDIAHNDETTDSLVEAGGGGTKIMASKNKIQPEEWGSFDDDLTSIEKNSRTTWDRESLSIREPFQFSPANNHAQHAAADKTAHGKTRYPISPTFDFKILRTKTHSPSSNGVTTTTTKERTKRSLYKPVDSTAQSSSLPKTSSKHQAVGVVKTPTPQIAQTTAVALHNDYEQPSNAAYEIPVPQYIGGRNPKKEKQRSKGMSSNGSSKMNRTDNNQRWRFRTDLLIIILLAVMLLAVVIAALSIFATSESQPSVSAVTSGKQPIGNSSRPIPIGGTTEPTLAPTVSSSLVPSASPLSSSYVCNSPAVAIRPFAVELTTIPGSNFIEDDLSEMIEATKRWIENVIKQNVAVNCYKSTTTTSTSLGVVETESNTYQVPVQYGTCVDMTGSSSCPEENQLWEMIRNSFSSGERRTRSLKVPGTTYLDFLRINLSENNAFRDPVAIGVTEIGLSPSPVPTWAPSPAPQSSLPSLTVLPMKDKPSPVPTNTPSSMRNPSSVPSQEPSEIPSISPTYIEEISVHPSVDQSLCAASPGCKNLKLGGHCCPTADGIFLGCCQEESGPIPSLSPISTTTDKPSSLPVALPPPDAPSEDNLKTMILEAAPPSTAAALDDPDSAQSQAYSHILDNYMESEKGQLLQKFALLTYSFETIQAQEKQSRRLVRPLSASRPLSHQRQLSAASWPTEGADECAWVGIFCDSIGLVVAVNVAQRKLPGRLVPEWAMLKDSLQLIDATNNELTGEIPPEYGDLSLLRWLRLSRNRLSGNIPESFVGLKALMQLDVFQNELGGDFPNAVISQLSGLMTLRVYFNSFSGSIDDSVCELGLSVFEADCNLGGECVSPCWAM